MKATSISTLRCYRVLGWFQDGIIWDHNGDKSGFTKEKSPVFTEFEPFKGFKKFKPFKAFEEFAPFQPFKSFSISTSTLKNFLLQTEE